MNESEEKPEFWVHQPLTREILIRRSPVIILMVYYVWILLSAWSMSSYWGWSFERGLEWSSSGPGTFLPYPSYPGAATAISSALMHDQIFYQFFMHGTSWIWTLILGFFYTFLPYRTERTNFCLLLKWALVVETVLFLIGALLITNIYPRALQASVYGMGLLLLVTAVVWLVLCKRHYSGPRVIG